MNYLGSISNMTLYKKKFMYVLKIHFKKIKNLYKIFFKKIKKENYSIIKEEI